MLLLRQLFDQESGTYTYLLADQASGEAVLIDPVKEKLQGYLQLLRELNLSLRLAVDTHVHADHVTALGDLRDATGCQTGMGSPSVSACVGHQFADGEKLTFGAYTLQALYTPGHTNDSYSFLLEADGRRYVFTGDTLLIRGTGRTDFQNGDARQQYHSLFNILLKLPADTVVYPGHDYKGWTISSIEEERRNNPRLQVSNVDEYVRLMQSLNLPNPRLMDVAVPANQACGQPLGF